MMPSIPLTNVIVAGIGGQGILTAAEILARVALAAGLDVKKSEVKGLSQRGGSVVSFVRFGPRVFSPIIEKGTAHLLVAFERAEALRWVHFLNPKDNTVVLNDLTVVPLPATLGLDAYPDRIEERLQRVASRLVRVNGPAVANRLGNPLVANTVVLGAVSTLLPFPEEIWHQVLEELFRTKHLEVNLRAFAEGRREAMDPRG